MTEPVSDRFDLERPEADVLDQRRVEAPPTEPELEPIDEMPAEASDADVLEQHQVVPVDDGHDS